MKILLSYIFSLFILTSFAQERLISGHVMDNNTKSSIEFANVLINSTTEPTTTIAYCFTNEQGNFNVKINESIKNIKIVITVVGYKAQTVIVSLDTLKTLNILMDIDVVTLQEVIVKRENTGDTLNLKTDRMNLTNESTLRDILNKTDGVVVSKDGAIIYNGKQITKVLINKKEVFINQNKIALDNLNYEIMDNVQIINNYKDKFIIDFNSMTVPVINIKTKAKFKGVLKYRAGLGFGYKDAYKVKGKSFFFSDKINMFLTTNSNNISSKDLSYADVAEPFVAHNSDFFKSKMFPFFFHSDFFIKNFNNSNSLTLRFQTTKSKVGAIFSYANIKTQQNTITTISNLDSVVIKENLFIAQTGALLTTNVNYSRLFSKRAVLNANTAIGFLSSDNKNVNDGINFYPTLTTFKELTAEKPQSFAISNNVKITKLLSKKTILNIGANYYNEASKNNFFSSRITASSNDGIYLQQKINKHVTTGSLNLKYKHSDLLALSGGLFYTKIFEYGNINFINNANYTKKVNRNLNNFQALFEINGEEKKIGYAASITPMIWRIANNGTQNIINTKIDVDIVYEVDYGQRIALQYNRNVALLDLNSSYDTIVQSYNIRIKNPSAIINNITSTNTLNIGYYSSNASKSRATFLIYKFIAADNFIQNIFDTVINNVFYFTNEILDKNNTHSINFGANKGFFITPKFHKLSFHTNFSFTKRTFPAINNKEKLLFKNNLIEQNIYINYILQSTLIKEIKIGTQITHQNIVLNNNSINKQKTINYYATVSYIKNKVECNIRIEDVFYKTPSANFHVPNINLVVKYKKSDKLSFALEGKSLFSLFNLINNSSSYINSFSDSKLITQTVHNGRIGYLILNINYKF